MVNLAPFGGEDSFRQPVYTQGTNANEQAVLHLGCTAEEAGTALSMLPGMAQAFFPPDVNIRIVMRGKVEGRHISTLVM